MPVFEVIFVGFLAPMASSTNLASSTFSWTSGSVILMDGCSARIFVGKSGNTAYTV
jgi:hypothetical protein